MWYIGKPELSKSSGSRLSLKHKVVPYRTICPN